MGKSGKYADLILPLALSQAYTFAVPSDLEKKIKLGQRVMVQFGPKRIYSALIWKIHSRAPEEEAKPILGILDENPLISIIQFRFWEWLSEYYLCTMGEVMNAALPAGLKLESQTRIHHQKDFDLQEELNDLEENALTFIKNNPGTNLMDLGKLMKRKNPIPLVNSLLHKNAIKLEEKLVTGYKPKEQMVISLSPELAQTPP